jgi:hypothetical protein
MFLEFSSDDGRRSERTVHAKACGATLAVVCGLMTGTLVVAAALAGML